MSEHWLWEGDAGRMEARLLAPCFSSVTLSGRVDNYAVSTVEDFLRAVGPIEGIDMFWDAYALQGVSGEFRSSATSLLLSNRKTIGSIVTLTSSALIAMAVSTANLVLGGMVEGFRERDGYEAKRREVAMRHGLDPAQLAS